MNKLTQFLILLIISVFLTNCQSGNFFKRSDVKDNPVNVEERVMKNVEEGRGIRFGKLKGKGGTFDFASSNELWRASVEVLDFVPLTNASYSGGIIITDWFDGNSKENNQTKRELKITVRFLTNEIRSDALKINIHERLCKLNTNDCTTNLIKSNISNEIKLAILKKAALLEKKKFEKNVKERRKQIPKRTKDPKVKN